MDQSEYWQHGKRHREDGPAVEMLRMGSPYREWWQNGKLDRKNNPALQWVFAEEWWNDGKRHCLDGPAVVQRQPTQVMPQPPIPCPPYPDYDNPNPGAVKLQDFQSLDILDVSRWLDKACYGRLGFFTSHGDFGAQVAVMLNEFGLEGNARHQLEEEVTVVIENKGELQRLDEYFRERPENGDSLMDLLGSYTTAEKRIRIFMPTLVACAQKLDARIPRRFGSPCAMTLFYMVFLHELAHAIHHLKLGFQQEEGLGDSERAENLAQHFTMTCIEAYGNRAKDVFDELEKHQPQNYRNWSNYGPCDWGNCGSNFP